MQSPFLTGKPRKSVPRATAKQRFLEKVDLPTLGFENTPETVPAANRPCQSQSTGTSGRANSSPSLMSENPLGCVPDGGEAALGEYRETLAAMVATSASGSGGSHWRKLWSTRAARIADSPSPRFRIVPAIEASVAFRAPSRICLLLLPLAGRVGLGADFPS